MLNPRIIIPYFDERGIPFRLSSRAIDTQKQRYIQTTLDENKPRLYNLDQIDPEKTVYVQEGQFDSMFIDNCVAVGTSNYDVDYLKNYKNKIFVPDNNPRNEIVCRNILNLINKNENVVIWQSNYGSDVNEMIINGYSKNDVLELIHQSTFSGIEAKLKFNEWVKCNVKR